MQKPKPTMSVNHHTGAKPKGKAMGPQPKPAPPATKRKGGSTRIPKAY